jgi:hypothetical protein
MRCPVRDPAEYDRLTDATIGLDGRLALHIRGDKYAN